MNDQRPNILYITGHCPFSPSYGSQQRILNIGRLLKQVGKVSLVIASCDEYGREELDRTKKEFDLKRIIRFLPSPRLHFINRIRHELDPSFLKTYYFHASKPDREFMLRMIDEHDVVWIHNVRVANAFQINRWAHSVFDVDDLPSRFYLSSARASSNIKRRLLNFRMSLIWWRRERLFRNRFDVIIVCSRDDQRYLGDFSRIHVIPNCFTHPPQEPHYAPSKPFHLGFIGNLNFMPNRFGIEWFIRDVWPLIKRDVPDAHLHLVGKGSDGDIAHLGPDIEGLGWVEDTSLEIASWSAMIVPIHMGSGTRVKIAEGFSRKCPIVSTSLGAFGYDVVNGEDILIADNAQDFASACILLLRDRLLGSRISENAWGKFLKYWTWDSISESVFNAVKMCLNRKNNIES